MLTGLAGAFGKDHERFASVEGLASGSGRLAVSGFTIERDRSQTRDPPGHRFELEQRRFGKGRKLSAAENTDDQAVEIGAVNRSDDDRRSGTQVFETHGAYIEEPKQCLARNRRTEVVNPFAVRLGGDIRRPLCNIALGHRQ